MRPGPGKDVHRVSSCLLGGGRRQKSLRWPRERHVTTMPTLLSFDLRTAKAPNRCTNTPRRSTHIIVVFHTFFTLAFFSGSSSFGAVIFKITVSIEAVPFALRFHPVFSLSLAIITVHIQGCKSVRNVIYHYKILSQAWAVS